MKITDEQAALIAVAKRLNRLDEDNRRLAARLAEERARAGRLARAIMATYANGEGREDTEYALALNHGDLDESET